jgi:ADP-ribose pyrophosphatase YjhB (NUDIX family)
MLLPVPPRVGVCAIIFPLHACGTVDVSHVLLVQRARAPAARLWAFPGGHVLSGERLAAAAAREVGEETGLAVSVPAHARPVAAQEALDHDPAGALLSHYLLAHVVGTWPWGAEPPPLAGDDAAAAAWVRTGAPAPAPALPPPPRAARAPASVSALQAENMLVPELPSVLAQALAAVAAGALR